MTLETCIVGVDWGSQQHQVCVCTGDGTIVEEQTVLHTGEALGKWVGRLLARVAGDATQLAVALETPRGAIVELLLAHGIPTFSINPKQSARFRERESVAGAKDDRRDARVLAQALRTDRGVFRRLSLEEDAVVELREWSRMDLELMEERNRLSSRLREQWQRYYPQLLTLVGGANEAWIWGVFELAPTPALAVRLRAAKITQLLRTHRIRRVDADGVLAILQTPALTVTAGTTAAAQAHAQQLITRLRLVAEQQSVCSRQIEALLARVTDPPDPPRGDAGPTDAAILQSMPGVGPVVASRVLTEATQPLAERAQGMLRSWAGLAPVTRQSGRVRVVGMRLACHRSLRDACFYWALSASTCDPASHRYYAALRARGHGHARALRSVADRLVRILFAMLRSRQLYDRTRFAEA
jgi:transposase